MSVGNVGIYMVVETDFGLVVKYDGDQHVEISLPGTYFSQVRSPIPDASFAPPLACAQRLQSTVAVLTCWHQKGRGRWPGG